MNVVDLNIERFGYRSFVFNDNRDVYELAFLHRGWRGRNADNSYIVDHVWDILEVTVQYVVKVW